MLEVLAKKISKLRGEEGLSQQQMSYLLRISRNTVSRLERRKINNPNKEIFERLNRVEELLNIIGYTLRKDPKKLIKFLQTPQDGLRGYKPYDLLNNAFSFEVLLDFIKGSKSGEMS